MSYGEPVERSAVETSIARPNAFCRKDLPWECQPERFNSDITGKPLLPHPPENNGSTYPPLHAKNFTEGFFPQFSSAFYNTIAKRNSTSLDRSCNTKISVQTSHRHLRHQHLRWRVRVRRRFRWCRPVILGQLEQGRELQQRCLSHALTGFLLAAMEGHPCQLYPKRRVMTGLRRCRCTFVQV